MPKVHGPVAVLEAQSKLEKAEALLRLALKACEHAFEPDALATRAAAADLARFLEAHGWPAEPELSPMTQQTEVCIARIGTVSTHVLSAS